MVEEDIGPRLIDGDPSVVADDNLRQVLTDEPSALDFPMTPDKSPTGRPYRWAVRRVPGDPGEPPAYEVYEAEIVVAGNPAQATEDNYRRSFTDEQSALNFVQGTPLEGNPDYWAIVYDPGPPKQWHLYIEANRQPRSARGRPRGRARR